MKASIPTIKKLIGLSNLNIKSINTPTVKDL